MKAPLAMIAFFLAMATSLCGCANTNQPAVSSSRAVYGVIDSIESSRDGSSDLGAGTVIGGVVGGVLGHQVGGGSGRDLSTIAGAVGGAVVGHQIEKSRRQSAYSVRVRLDNGDYETVTQQDVSDLRVKDRVRIENNRVLRDR